MSKRKIDSVELLRRILRIDDDLLDPNYPKALIDQELREAGGDPERIGAEGEAFVKKLLAERAEAESRKASGTRLRSQQRASSAPPAKNLSSLPPMRAKAPSDADTQSEE